MIELFGMIERFEVIELIYILLIVYRLKTIFCIMKIRAPLQYKHNTHTHTDLYAHINERAQESRASRKADNDALVSEPPTETEKYEALRAGDLQYKSSLAPSQARDKPLNPAVADNPDDRYAMRRWQNKSVQAICLSHQVTLL